MIVHFKNSYFSLISSFQAVKNLRGERGRGEHGLVVEGGVGMTGKNESETRENEEAFVTIDWKKTKQEVLDQQ